MLKVVLYCFLVITSILSVIAFILSLKNKNCEGFNGDGIEFEEFVVKECQGKKCCPHMSQSNGKYAEAKTEHKLIYRGKNYTFYTCCNACAEFIKDHPEDYIVLRNGKPFLKHKDTDEIVQALNENF